MIKKRFLLPAAAGALALTIGLTGIWFNQQLPALADFGVSGMDSEAQLMAWAALFPEKGVAALTFRTVLQWMAIAVFCTLGAVVLANPFDTALLLIRFIGVSLVVVGCAGLGTSMLVSRMVRDFYADRFGDPGPIEVEEVDVTDKEQDR